jgi:hypothetical protein
MGPMGCPETSLRNYHYTLRIDQKSPVLRLSFDTVSTEMEYDLLLFPDTVNLAHKGIITSGGARLRVA